MSEWQPIETAPKDGTFVLLFCPSGIEDRSYEVDDAPLVTIGSFDAANSQSRQWLSIETVTYVTDYGGQTGVCEETYRIGVSPARWKPLDPPPVETERR